MSRTVDNRVVNMEFNNQQFEKAVAQSRQSIQLLEKDIKTLELIDALNTLGVAANKIDLSHIRDGVQSIADRFSTLGVISMSVINTITSAITNNLLGAIHNVTGSLSGVFQQIHDRGYTRATNIQKANFALQGLLTTQYKIKDENGQWIADMDTIKQKQQEIGKVIDASVTGTAYGYDQAARVASTLAASYGTSSEGIAGIGKALKSIVGMAGQTGQDFDTVARVFTKVAASGKAMSMELNSVSAWGVGATAMIADYINADKDLTKQMNKSLTTRKQKRKDYQLITEADVYDLASKGKITADMFIKVFEPFFENAQKANDTLDGVMKNIGAALGRLGASFIMPIMQNEGPQVKFLQAVRQKLVDILNMLNQIHFQDKILEPVIRTIERLTEVVNDFHIPNEVKDFFNIIGTAFSFNAPQWVDELNANTADILKNLVGLHSIERQGTRDLKSYFTKNRLVNAIKDILVEEYGYSSGLIDTQMALETINSILNDEDKAMTTTTGVLRNYSNIHKDAIRKIVDDWANEYTETAYSESEVVRAVVMKLTGTDKNYEDVMRALKSNMNPIELAKVLTSYGISYVEFYEEMDRISNLHRDAIDSFNGLDRPMDELVEQADKIARANQKIKDVYSFNYLQKIFDAFANLRDVFIEVKTVFWDAFVETSEPFKEFFGGSFTGATLLRDVINKLSQSIYDITDSIKTFFTETDEGHNIIKGFGSAVGFLSNVVYGLVRIFKNASDSFAPLGQRILSLFSSIGENLSELFNLESEFGAIDIIVNAVSGAIDLLANGIISLWDFIAKINFSWLIVILQLIFGGLYQIGNYIYSNWDSICEELNKGLSLIGDVLSFVWELIVDKVIIAFGFLASIFEKVRKVIYDATGGLIDIMKPFEFFIGLFDVLNSDIDETGNTVVGTEKKFKRAIDYIVGYFQMKFENLKKNLTKIKDEIVGLFAEILKNPNEGFSGVADKVRYSGRFPFLASILEMIDKVKDSIRELIKLLGGGIAEKIRDIYYGIQGKESASGKDMSDNPIVKFAGIISSIKEKIIGFFADTSGGIGAFFEDIKNLDFDEALDKIERIVSVVIGAFLGVETGKTIGNIGNMSTNIGKFFKSLGTSLKQFAIAMNPINAIDNKTTRRQAAADVIKSVALSLVALSASLVIITRFVDLSKIDACLDILITFFGGIMMILGINNDFMAGSKKALAEQTSFKGFSIGASAGARFGSAALIASIGVMLAEIGWAVLEVVAAISILTALDSKKLESAMPIFWQAAIAVGVLVVIVGIFAGIMQYMLGKGTLTNNITGYNHNNGTPIYEVIKSKSAWAPLLALGFAVKGITEGMAEILAATAAFVAIAGDALDSRKKIDRLKDLMDHALLLTTVVLLVVGAYAALDEYISSSQKGVSLEFLNIAALGGTVWLLMQAITGILAAVAILFEMDIFGDTRKFDETWKNIKEILNWFNFFLAYVVIVFGAASAALTYFMGPEAALMLLMFDILLGVIGGMVAIISYATKELLNTGASIDEIKEIMYSFVGVIAIIVILAALVSALAAIPEVTVGVAIAAALFYTIALALGALALIIVAIGVLAYLVSSAAKKFTEALHDFIDALLLLKDVDPKEMKKAARNMRKVFKTIAQAIIDGIIEFGNLIERNKDGVIKTIIQILSVTVYGLWYALPMLLEIIGDILGLIVDYVAGWFEEHRENLAVILANIVLLLVDFLAQLADGVFKIYVKLFTDAFNWLMNFITESVPTWVTTIINFINTLADTIRAQAPELLDAIANLVDAVWIILLSLFGIEPGKSEEDSAAYNLIKTFLKLLFAGKWWILTDKDKATLRSFVSAVGDTIAEIAKELFYAMNPIGYWVLRGIAKSLGKAFGTDFETAVRDALDIDSPSKKLYKDGNYAVEGFTNAVFDSMGAVRRAGEKMSKTFSNAFEKKGSPSATFGDRMKQQLGFLIDEINIFDDLEFSISPYLDLTQIKSEIPELDSILGENSESALDFSSITGDVDKALDVSSSFDELKGIGVDVESIDPDNALGQITNVNFTQNNYSPESLSRIDIYRDTERMLNNPTLANMFNR